MQTNCIGRPAAFHQNAEHHSFPVLERFKKYCSHSEPGILAPGRLVAPKQCEGGGSAFGEVLAKESRRVGMIEPKRNPKVKRPGFLRYSTGWLWHFLNRYNLGKRQGCKAFVIHRNTK
jgi:hypothetical protein